MASRIPLDLYAEVTTANGTRYKWDANQAPGSRLQNLSFRTKIGEGFSDASGQLARRIDADYPDLNLVDTVTFTGADGSVAYEGRMSAMPRDLGDTHSISVVLAGWMAHAKDRKFTEIYVDRSPSSWEDMDLATRAALAGSWTLDGFGVSIGGGGITWDVAPQLFSNTFSQLTYTAPTGVQVAKLGYRGARTGTFSGNFESPAVIGTFGSVALTLDDTLRSATFAAASLISLRLMLNPGTTPATALQQRYSKLAVYGSNTVTTRVGDPAEPDGVWVSDVIKDIATRWCPQLDTSGVRENQYVVQHCAFRDRTFPYDAWLELNKYALWNLSVWENKRLDFKPYDLSDYDWEIRTDDPGTTFSPLGPSTEDLFNGIAVTYQDPLTGVVATITPDTNVVVADTSSTNPWNQHGVPHWDEITLSTPTLAATAAVLGQAALADRNRPRTPGIITVRGYIRDRAGNPQPCWKVRAGDTISITNFPNDSPRLIVETDYDDESKQVRLSIDKPFALLDAYLDRLQNGLEGRG
jgi:hypothetical protein